jgi:DNA-binding SARP family transcriptional activator
MVEFRLLGTLDAGERGSAALGGRKQRTLLAYLLLHRNEAIPRDVLIDALWPEDPPATAAHALDVYVSRLRKSLGADGLFETRGGSVRLNVSDEAVDAACFEQRVDAARRAEVPADRLAALEQALALWRGRALVDLLDEPALRPERERLEEERLGAEEERFEAMLALGRHGEAIGALQALASEHPLRERPRRLLMVALYRAGRQSEALEVYRSFRRLLSDDLGLEPSLELRELEAAVLRHDRTLAPPASADSATAAAEASPVPLAPPATPPRMRRNRRRAAAAIAGVVAAAVGALFAALALSGGGSARPALTVPDLSAAAIDPATGKVVDVVPLQDPPAAALTVGNTVWIASWVSRTLTRLDDRTGKLLGNVGLPCHPLALAYGAGRIWIASRDRPCSLMAVDPRSGDVKQWPLHQPGLGVFSSQGWGASGIAFASNSVWVTIGVSGLVRVSPAGKVERNFVVGPDPRGVAATQGAVWVNILGPAQLVEIDPTSNSSVGHVNVGTTYGAVGPAGPVPCTLAGSGQTVWVPATGEGSSTSSGIWRVDAIRHRVSGIVRAGGNPCGVSLGHRKVWVANPSIDEVDEISPLTDTLVRRIPLDSPPNAITAAPRHVWVVTG